MASGVKVSDETKGIFEQLKLKKKAVRYVIFKIEDGFIQIEKTGGRETSYLEFLEEIKLLEKECRYLLYDYPEPCHTGGNQSLDRLLLLSWCPEGAPIKSKMLYASSLDAIKRSFVGVYRYIQATGLDEIDECAVLDCITHMKR